MKTLCLCHSQTVVGQTDYIIGLRVRNLFNPRPILAHTFDSPYIRFACFSKCITLTNLLHRLNCYVRFKCDVQTFFTSFDHLRGFD